MKKQERGLSRIYIDVKASEQLGGYEQTALFFSVQLADLLYLFPRFLGNSEPD
jgi:hypothetical protein